MRGLVHVCCAGCLLRFLEGGNEGEGDGVVWSGWFYNPNIHPLLEFRRRLKAVKMLAERIPTPLEWDEDYGLETFLRALKGAYDPEARCAACYRLRLEATARKAAEEGYGVFSTTLLTSRQQPLEQVRAAGEAAAKTAGVRFHFRDLRAAQEPERSARGLYRQSYCGCVFSEEARYAATTKHIYPSPGVVRRGGVDEREGAGC